MPSSNTTLQRYFTGIAESVFQTQLGVADVEIIDYLGDLLLRFVRVDAIHRIRNLSGRPMTEVAEMLVEANARIGTARREVHRHIGDFTLFWAGVYPEALREMRSPHKKDHFIDYCAQGKMAYRIASTMESDETSSAPADVLERLSARFEMCAYGLREVRREWERRDDDMIHPLVVN
ncbi:MAG: hypothetical protein AB7O38_12130 [Pirellulaceae bacterium]